MANIIFDFDGTIADSLNVVVEVIEDLLGNKDKISVQELQELRKLPLKEIARQLNVKKYKIPFLLIKGRKLMGSHIADLSIFPGLSQIIKQLHSDGHVLYIISTNSSSNICKFLKRQNLLNYFNQVYGNVGIFKKNRALRKLVRNNHIKPQDSIYIGDEPRDIESSKAVGIACIAVSWGFSSEKILTEHRPYAVVKTPDEIITKIRQYFKLLQ